jgi:hypothetical protein
MFDTPTEIPASNSIIDIFGRERTWKVICVTKAKKYVCPTGSAAHWKYV